MLAEITSALSSLKIASDIIKGFNTLKTEATIKEKSIELQNIIISLQQSIFLLQSKYETITTTKKELENEIDKLKDWEKVKKKYVLKEVAQDVIAYTHKNKSQSVNEKHWLCANCFDNDKVESIYQVKKPGNISFHIYYCPKCENEIWVKNPDYQPPKPPRRGTGRNWVTDF